MSILIFLYIVLVVGKQISKKLKTIAVTAQPGNNSAKKDSSDYELEPNLLQDKEFLYHHVEDVSGQQSDSNTITTLAMPQQSTEAIYHDDSLEERLSIEPQYCPQDTTPVVPQQSIDMVHHDDSLEGRPSIRYLINPTMFDNEDHRYKTPPSYYNIGMSINHPHFPYDARCLPRQTESSSAIDHNLGQRLFDQIFAVEFYYY